MTACLSVWAAIELKRYMKIDPEKVKLLRIAVEHKFGSSPGSPSDFDRLADEIDAVVGQRIGVSTLKTRVRDKEHHKKSCRFFW
mgnify:CR=1 FL=1|jgi:hypothetical protein